MSLLYIKDLKVNYGGIEAIKGISLTVEKGEIVTSGGRVLAVTAVAGTLQEARAKAYAATERVHFANKYMRHDIGHAIDEV